MGGAIRPFLYGDIMIYFKKVSKDEIIDYNLEVCDNQTQGRKVPVRTLQIEEEISEPISLIALIEKMKEKDNLNKEE